VKKDDNPTFKAAVDEEFVRSFSSMRRTSMWVFSGIPRKRSRQSTAWRLPVIVYSVRWGCRLAEVKTPCKAAWLRLFSSFSSASICYHIFQT
jgi:hypothetical protein